MTASCRVIPFPYARDSGGHPEGEDRHGLSGNAMPERPQSGIAQREAAIALCNQLPPWSTTEQWVDTVLGAGKDER